FDCREDVIGNHEAGPACWSTAVPYPNDLPGIVDAGSLRPQSARKSKICRLVLHAGKLIHKRGRRLRASVDSHNLSKVINSDRESSNIATPKRESLSRPIAVYKREKAIITRRWSINHNCPGNLPCIVNRGMIDRRSAPEIGKKRSGKTDLYKGAILLHKEAGAGSPHDLSNIIDAGRNGSAVRCIDRAEDTAGIEKPVLRAGAVDITSDDLARIIDADCLSRRAPRHINRNEFERDSRPDHWLGSDLCRAPYP